MRVALAAIVVLALGCAPSVPPARAPVAPSTHRDPPAHVPSPAPSPRTGELVGVTASGGEDQAREVFVTLVRAIVDGDAEALESVLGAKVFHGGSLRAGRVRAASAGGTVASQLLTHARMRRLSPAARFDELVEVASIRVDPVASVLPPPLPPELQPGDLVVRFTLTSAGRDPLATLGPDGNGLLVVRPGEDPRVIAR